uniref:Uncharacterized protein n=1 Tax=Timema genevievae TaxID=629358 RepID=A0A7R9JYA1_TIMGE|nr:unnamed protein product [Timema genevievae]
MGTTSQQYCLRWNNHRSNLLTVFDELLRSEAFTDVTLACEGSVSVKCHKMVLAACSSYFQALFTELPCRHPVVVLKDVKYSEMKAILEYMYRGEVNVAQDQLAALLKVAQALKVKGLVEERGPATSTPRAEGEANPTPGEEDPRSPPNIATSVAPLPHSSSGNTSPPQSSGMPHYDKNPPYNLYGKSPVGRMSLPMWAVPGLPFPHHPHHPSPVPAAPGMCYEASSADMSPLKRKKLQSLLMSRDTPILRTVLGQGQPDSSQQPMALVCQPDSHDRPTQYNGSAQEIDKRQGAYQTHSLQVYRPGVETRCTPDPQPPGLQAWSRDKVHTRPGVETRCTPDHSLQAWSRDKKCNQHSLCDQGVDLTQGAQLNSHKVECLVYTLCDQGVDLTQGAQLNSHKVECLVYTLCDQGLNLTQGAQLNSHKVECLVYTLCDQGLDLTQGAQLNSHKQSLKVETSLEEARSPYTDISGVDEETNDKVRNSSWETKVELYTYLVSSGIATYVPTQKPEWKRYKQYTRNDIMSAIEAVRTGMSALQAARKYGVPSRTLYDKVKKMGITTSRPFNKRVSSAGTGGGGYFPYGGSGGGGSNSMGSMFGGESDEMSGNPSTGLMEPLFLQHALDGMKREIGEREALAALKREMGGDREAMATVAAAHSGASSSPGENGRSPSPGLKYHNSLTPSPDEDRDDDQVEDLSVARKPEPIRVIMPPMNQQPKKDEEESHHNSLEIQDRLD